MVQWRHMMAEFFVNEGSLPDGIKSIAWTNVDVPSDLSSGIHLKDSSKQLLMNLIRDTS